jgi:hypothetical protein
MRCRILALTRRRQHPRLVLGSFTSRQQRKQLWENLRGVLELSFRRNVENGLALCKPRQGAGISVLIDVLSDQPSARRDDPRYTIVVASPKTKSCLTLCLYLLLPPYEPSRDA